MEKEIISSIIEGIATLSGALIIGIAGGLISKKYSQERDRQDKESQWRDHAIELTKLDFERKKLSNPESPLRPCILDFLANYRDLKELDYTTPKDLYILISKKRITKTNDKKNENDS